MSDPDAKILRDEGRLFLGESDATREVRRLIRRAAKVDTTVLITGESGVGKELVAREIHLRSARRNGPFIPLNCAAIPDTLIEAELFGHEPGAFTDARVTTQGRLRACAQRDALPRRGGRPERRSAAQAPDERSSPARSCVSAASARKRSTYASSLRQTTT